MTVLDILSVVEGPNALEGCLLGRTHCSDERACPTHFFWKQMREEVRSNLSRMTLREVADFERREGRLPCCSHPVRAPESHSHPAATGRGVTSEYEELKNHGH
jgi:Rrf2 family transcriptional regulator, iron-sulfur cluster assembly transcription factor